MAHSPGLDPSLTLSLKSLFGVDELQRVRQLGGGAVGRIKDLNNQARQEDARLLTDPGAQAQADRERHERAALGAADLNDRLAELLRLQIEAAQTSQHARLSGKAAAELTERRVIDYGRTTAAVRQAQDELQQLQEANAAAETATILGLAFTPIARASATRSAEVPSTHVVARFPFMAPNLHRDWSSEGCIQRTSGIRLGASRSCPPHRIPARNTRCGGSELY